VQALRRRRFGLQHLRGRAKQHSKTNYMYLERRCY
jgi:hypothetical protein